MLTLPKTLRFTGIAFLFATTVAAHDTWLAPDRFHVAAPAAVTLSLTSGMEFPKLDHAIKADRIAVSRARYEARVVDLAVRNDAPNAVLLPANALAGVTTFWVVLHPRRSELKREQVREYVEHLNIAEPARVIASWEKRRATTLKYRYTKYAKTFTRAGSEDVGRAWSEPTVMRLELVPESDPTRRKVGDTLRIRLLDEGKPRPHYPVSVVHAEVTRNYRTDAQGRVAIDIPSAGPYLVRATTLVPAAVRDADWDVHFTTLSFEAHTN